MAGDDDAPALPAASGSPAGRMIEPP